MQEEMDTILNFVASIAWPLAFILFIVMFRSEVRSVMRLASAPWRPQRFRARIANTEINWDIQEVVSDIAEQIAREQDPKKRLSLARQPFLLSKAMQDLSEDDLVLLKTFHERQRMTFYVDLYKGELQSFNKFLSLAIVHPSVLNSPSLYDDFFGEFTPLGREVIETAFPKRRETVTASASALKPDDKEQ